VNNSKQKIRTLYIQKSKNISNQTPVFNLFNLNNTSSIPIHHAMYNFATASNANSICYDEVYDQQANIFAVKANSDGQTTTLPSHW